MGVLQHSPEAKQSYFVFDENNHSTIDDTKIVQNTFYWFV